MFRCTKCKREFPNVIDEGELVCNACRKPIPTDVLRETEIELGKQLELDALIVEIRNLPPMTQEQKAEQAASFAYGNIALTKEYRDAPPAKLEELRVLCRRAAGLT